MNKLLWPDERIHRELDIATDAMLDYATSFNVGLDVALKVSKAMRDEYEARIAALEAPGASVQVALDAPDSPGWWAFEGTYAVWFVSTPMRTVWAVEIYEGELWACTQDGRSRCPVGSLKGKWTRVYMPWETQRTPAPALPGPLVMPPDRFGTVVIWPQGEVQERMFSSRIEIFPAYNPPFEPGIRWTGRELIGIEITRQWAKAMLLAANIAESMRQRPAAQGESNG